MSAPLVRGGAAATVDAHAADAPVAVAPRCRNCGAPVAGHYCANCGQETSLALPSAGRFLREAAGRYIAFDGRFWRSMHRLMFRPGVLTRDYLAGRRRQYVRPTRLFVGLSILFFALLQLTTVPVELVDARAHAGASTSPAGAAAANPSRARSDEPGLDVVFDDVTWSPAFAPLRERFEAFNRLPAKDKLDRIVGGSFRYGPYAAIVLLPVFALLLKIAYAGSGSRHPARPRLYAAHLVFSAHNHAFLFVALAMIVLVPSTAVRATLAIWMVIYALASKKTVYGGRWPGVVARALFVAAGYAVFFAFAVVGLLVAAVTLR